MPCDDYRAKLYLTPKKISGFDILDLSHFLYLIFFQRVHELHSFLPQSGVSKAMFDGLLHSIRFYR